MKPIWKDGKLTVQLHKPDEAILKKAQKIGEALKAMNQDAGANLVDAINGIFDDRSAQTPAATAQTVTA